MGRCPQSLARTCHPRLRIDDDARRLDLGGDRAEREQRRGRVAPGFAMSRPSGGRNSRPHDQPRVRPERMLEPVPPRGRPASTNRCSERSTTTPRGGTSSPVRVLMGGTTNVTSAPRERCGVRDERRRTPAVPARAVDRACRPAPRERVRPQRVHRAPVREHPVERLLTGIPRSSDYRHARHGTYYAHQARIMRRLGLGERHARACCTRARWSGFSS